MTAAAFKASYSDWKLVKTRGVVQVIFEVPLSESDLAYNVVGGMPDFGQEKWFAIARLDPDKAVKPRPKLAAEKRLVQQAGIVCADPVFQRFLVEENLTAEASEQLATVAVRQFCEVESRSEIIPGSAAAEKWDQLHGRFLAWRLAA